MKSISAGIMTQTSGKSPRIKAQPIREDSSLWPARSLENSVVWTLWLTYGAFYFCRTNISAAVPGMKASAAEGGLALSGEQVGWILAALKIAYGVGQLINGQLSERISPRVMLTLGMFGSAALNVAFGLGAGFFFLLFVWATNGFCQSLGWTPSVRVAANWVPVERRGNALGIIGTGYQITLGLTYLVAATAAEQLGWRGAFYVPAALLTLAGLFMLVFLRESPEEAISNDRIGAEMSSLPASRLSLSDALYWTLYNPVLWLLGLSLGLLNACRYGFLDWGVAHLMETRDVRVGKAGLQFFVIAIGATAGSYLAGWATDRWFGGRRGPVICVLMATLGCLSLMYNWAVQSSVVGSMLLLVIIGFCIYGPQVLLVGTAPADLAHRGTSAAAAGFVNFMGYMGAATGDVITGYFSSPEHGGWQVAIYIWAGWAFAGAVIVAILWNTTSEKVGVLPGSVPRLAGIVTLAVAASATMYGGQHGLVPLATVAAAILLAATYVNRWAAVPGFAVAICGLLFVFTAYIQRTGNITWSESTAMAAYSLAIICTLMILVDRGAKLCESS
jgi:MFS transporter, OPA family, glycerol-3-phosphate transporter